MLLNHLSILQLAKTFVCKVKILVSLYQEDEEGSELQDDLELKESLTKQRRRAIRAAQGGHKTFAKRNTCKDKGGKCPQNTRIQSKQMCSSWN